MKINRFEGIKVFSILYIIAALFFLLLTSFKLINPKSKITIAAAANIKTALDSIVIAFKKSNPGSDIVIIYGASGKLFEQISNDAPFDIFLSADMVYPYKLKEKNLVISEIRIYAVGQLVLWSNKTDPNPKQLYSLTEKSINKIALANPAIAPYGEKSVECLKYFQLYDKVKSKLVYGENIIQTAQFVSSGAADIGFLSLSIALSPNMQKFKGKYFIIPEKSHLPIEQGCVLLKHAYSNTLASEFFSYLFSSNSLGILKFYGYTQSTK